ncbi:mitochondrial inner membrane protein required for protein import [Quaeritorhiza haematococci]|nr:mitochondrial inner membrane protein required for protein import [Quaeritorhiza haematococci]
MSAAATARLTGRIFGGVLSLVPANPLSSSARSVLPSLQSTITKLSPSSSFHSSSTAFASSSPFSSPHDSEASKRNAQQQNQQSTSQREPLFSFPKQPEEEVEESEEMSEIKRKRLEQAAEAAERKRLRKIGKYTFAYTVLGTATMFAVMGMPSKEDPEDPNEPFLEGYWRRAVKNTKAWFTTAAAPAYGEKILPDMLPEPYSRPLTLVIELNDTLSHLVWDREFGWRVAARPGVKEFLAHMNRFYEVVIFANTPAMSTQPVVDALDPYGCAMYKLYRESTRLINDKHVKDLSTLNRDLNKLVAVDPDPKAVELQPDNAITIKKWTGEKGDRELQKMMTFLEELALMVTYLNMPDVRPLLKIAKSYDPEDLPNGWQLHKDNMRKQFAAERKQQVGASNNSVGGAVSGFLGRLVGKGANLNETGASIGSSQFQTIFDIIEQAAREERELAKKDLAQMDVMRQQQVEEQRKIMEDLKNKKLKMWDYMFGNPIPPPGSQPQQAQ